MKYLSRFCQYVERHPLSVIYIAALIVLTLYNLTPPIKSFDTSFYLLAADNLLNGRLDCLRTPVYPILLKLCSVPCNGTLTETLVCIIQSVIYLISIRSLYLLVSHIVHQHWIVFFTTFMYCLLPAASWCNELITESLSISFTVILCHWLLCFHRVPTWKRALSISILLLIMVMLRTNFIAFFAILPVVWLWQWISTRKSIFATAILFLLIPIGCYFGYCKVFQKQYGIFAASISTACDYYNLRRSGLWNIDLLTDNEQIAACQYIESKNDPSYSTLYHLIDSTNDASSISNAFRKMKATTKKELFEYKTKIFSESLSSQITMATNTHTPMATTLFLSAKFLSMPLSTLYLFVVLLAFAILIHFFRHKRVPLPIVLLWCIATAQCFGIPIKGSDSFGRLLLPIYPIILCLMAWTVEKIWQKCR